MINKVTVWSEYSIELKCWFLKFSFWISKFNINWNSDINAHSQAPSRSTKSEILGRGILQLV